MGNQVEMDDDGNLKVSRPKISGKIKLTYQEATEAERALEVDADAYMAELRGQVRTAGVIPACSNASGTYCVALLFLQTAFERALLKLTHQTSSTGVCPSVLSRSLSPTSILLFLYVCVARPGNVVAVHCDILTYVFTYVTWFPAGGTAGESAAEGARAEE